MKLLIAFCAAVVAFAQTAPKIDRLTALPNGNRVGIVFKPEIRGNTYTGPALGNSCGLTEPVGIQVGTAGTLTSTNIIQIALRERLTTGTVVKVKCDSVDYADTTSTKKTVTNLEATTTVETDTNAEKFLLGKIDGVRKQAKKVSEKNIFASGFVTTASTGTAGGGDIAINPDFKIPYLTSFLRIKKTTQEGGDAKHFEAGVGYQAFFASNRAAYREVAGMGNATPSEILARFEAEKKSGYAKAFAGSSLDLAAKIEGAAGGFEVTNLVGDTAFNLRSNTGALGNSGYFRMYLMPAALEGGQSHANQEATAAAGSAAAAKLVKPDWIARYKTGLGFRLHYENKGSQIPIQRIELAGDGVFRYLFLEEALWDAKTKSVSKTGMGGRGYGQVDLKVYVGETGDGRYGVKLSYNRGSLPPVFARVRSFQFGFLWESKEDQ